MNFLPYGTSGPMGWIAAGGSSALIHGVIVFAAAGGLSQMIDHSGPAPERPRFTVTLEQLESDTLAGIVERSGVAGADDTLPETEQPDTGQPVPETINSIEAEDFAALTPEAIAPLTPTQPARVTAPQTPQAVAPDRIGPTIVAPETIEPETANVPPAITESIPPQQPDAEQIPPDRIIAEPVIAEPVLTEPVIAEPVVTVPVIAEPTPLELAVPQSGETIASPAADTLAALEPVAPQAVAPVLADTGPIIRETMTPQRSEVTAPPGLAPISTVTASPGRAASLDPVASASDTLFPDRLTAPESPIPGTLIPETLTANARMTGQQVTTLGAQPQSLTAVAPPALPASRPALPSPALPSPVTAPPPPQSAQDLAIGDLIQRIRAALSDPCLLALPRRDGADGAGLALISATEGAMAQFANDVLTGEDAALRQTRTLVDPRQCPALTYVRQNRDYPATRLGLQIDAAEVPSGGRLTGVLRGTAGRYLLLFLVDNNGVVQDLQRFVSFSGNFARFDVPVTRAGAARDTSQLLLAIATQRPGGVLRDRTGQLAQDVFAALEGEVATGAALAIATFDVR